MSENPMNKPKGYMIYTASGLRTDIETLFTAFGETFSTKYVVFVKCFKDLNFSLIFRGRHNDNEMHEFIDECYLEVLSQLVNKDKPLSHRICSLYLLYSLYVKQPLNQSLKTRFDIKIRITLDQLLTIREFIDDCKQRGLLDVCYVWYKLVSIGVQFVYYRYQSIGPSNTRSIHYYLFQNINPSVDKAIIDFKKSMDSRIETLQTNHDMYVDYKDKEFDDIQYPMDLKPNIINHELFTDSANNLTKLVNDFKYKNREFRGRGRPSVWTAYRDDEKESESSPAVDRRVYVRKKALKSKVKVENDCNILWTEDIIHSLKEGKERKAKKKREKRSQQLKPKKDSKNKK